MSKNSGHPTPASYTSVYSALVEDVNCARVWERTASGAGLGVASPDGSPLHEQSRPRVSATAARACGFTRRVSQGWVRLIRHPSGASHFEVSSRGGWGREGEQAFTFVGYRWAFMGRKPLEQFDCEGGRLRLLRDLPRAGHEAVDKKRALAEYATPVGAVNDAAPLGVGDRGVVGL